MPYVTHREGFPKSVVSHPPHVKLIPWRAAEPSTSRKNRRAEEAGQIADMPVSYSTPAALVLIMEFAYLPWSHDVEESRTHRSGGVGG